MEFSKSVEEVFRTKHGRPPYPGEPENGFRASVFRRTEHDDGTVTIGGYIKEYNAEPVSKKFEKTKFVMKGIRDPHDIVFSSADWTFQVPVSYCQMLSRGEFVERLYLIMDFQRANHSLDSSRILSNLAAVEEFAGRPLPKVVLSALIKHSLGKDSEKDVFRLSEEKALLLDKTTRKTCCVAKDPHDLENRIRKLLVDGKLPLDEWNTNRVCDQSER